jgi:hypothetical protein
MKITVNGNLCEIKPIWSEMQNTPAERMYTLKIKCCANKVLSVYEKNKICDAVECIFLKNNPRVEG